MRDDRPTLALEEYRALRATIRERGTLRLFVIVLTFVSWAAIAIAGVAIGTAGSFAALAGLIVLAAGFEVALAAHAGVERVGRYLQLHFEHDGPAPPRWEHAVMAPGGAAGGGPMGALFAPLFTVAALANVAALLFSAEFRWPGVDDAAAIGLAGGLMLHVAFMLRVHQGVRFTSRQRAADLEALGRHRDGTAG